MKTLAQGALDMQRAAKALGGSIPRSAVLAAAQEVKSATKAEMDRIAPSGRFSHVGKKGAAVGVSYTIRGGTALVHATGPWQLVENDTKAHPEVPRSIGRLRRRQDGILDRSKAGRHEAKQRYYEAIFGQAGGFAGAKPLNTPYGPRFRVNIPMIPGRHPWAHGVDKALPVAREAMRASVIAPLRAIFR